ncbi:MAG TPA: ABC transporter ATP-binding protein [Solirubrobacteraceae bacterium]|jgi:ATP-binding cassette subfamily B protein|nr:ABC transporter ATP-binding protein [Solirubrobacteraceae bacterium]
MEAKASTKETLRFCVEVSRPYKRYLIGGWVAVILGALIDGVATPLVFAEALERITRLRVGASLWHTFGTLVILYAALLVVGTICWRLAGWLEWEGCTKAFANSISVAFDRLLELSYRWHVDHPSGEVSSTLSTFSWALMQSIDELTWGMLRIVTGVFAGIVVLLVVAWPVGLTIGVFTAIFVWLIVIRSKPVTEASARFSAAHTQAEGVAFDVIRNIATVKAQSDEALERVRLSMRLDYSVAADLGARRAFTVTRTWMSVIINTMSWGALFIGVVLALHHDVSAGIVYLILFYASQIADQVIQSFQTVRSLSRALGRGTKFVGLINSEPEVTDAPDARTLAVSRGKVEFRSASFSYIPEQPLIEGLDLTVAPGERVGVVGPSGGGKSTLTRLLLRFVDVTAGDILIDGQSLRAVTQDSLRRNISYVPQDPQMLHRSVAENIWLGIDGPPDVDRIVAVSRAAHVHEFVSELPDGYDTIVGERGLKLSGGQRQRVAIAQAMLKRAPILILDEATSALDSNSEQLVQSALWSLMEHCTSLVVAHRLSTIARLDRIIVVEDGAITDSGTHAELLAHGGTYAKLWSHQSGGFID